MVLVRLTDAMTHCTSCLYLLQCVDVNSISLYDSDVRRENFETLRVLLWKKLLAQDLQNLTEIKEISLSEGFQ